MQSGGDRGELISTHPPAECRDRLLKLGRGGLDESLPDSPDGGLGAVAHADLPQDVLCGNAKISTLRDDGAEHAVLCGIGLRQRKDAKRLTVRYDAKRRNEKMPASLRHRWPISRFAPIAMSANDLGRAAGIAVGGGGKPHPYRPMFRLYRYRKPGNPRADLSGEWVIYIVCEG